MASPFDQLRFGLTARRGSTQPNLLDTIQQPLLTQPAAPGPAPILPGLTPEIEEATRQQTQTGQTTTRSSQTTQFASDDLFGPKSH